MYPVVIRAGMKIAPFQKSSQLKNRYRCGGMVLPTGPGPTGPDPTRSGPTGPGPTGPGPGPGPGSHPARVRVPPCPGPRHKVGPGNIIGPENKVEPPIHMPYSLLAIPYWIYIYVYIFI